MYTVWTISNILHVVPALKDAETPALYWVFLAFTALVLLATLASLIYVLLYLGKSKFPIFLPVRFLRTLVLLEPWALFVPFLECLLSVYDCDHGVLSIDTSVECYQGWHLAVAVVAGFCIAILVLTSGFFLILGYHTWPSKDDAFSK